jgi:hypothetical protein
MLSMGRTTIPAVSTATLTANSWSAAIHWRDVWGAKIRCALLETADLQPRREFWHPTRSLIRLAASVLIEQNDEWLVGRRYLSNHSLEALLEQEKDNNDREEKRELTAA